MENPKQLAIIVPAYNEEEILKQSAKTLVDLLQSLIEDKLIAANSYICFVNDGSRDQTWQIIEELSQESKYIKGIKLARNFGHQSALLAGLFEMQAELYVSIDADLQDDEKVIREMVLQNNGGFDVVYGVRAKREVDGFLKRATALGFYKLMALMGVQTVYNHADFRLLSNRAVEALKQFPETNLFLRGLVPLIGFVSTSVFYNRKARLAGETKYPLRKMLSFAWEGITSFSVQPLKIATVMGFLMCFVSFILLLYSLWAHYYGHTESGWTSLIFSIYFLGGVQLFCIGIIGEYMGKVYKEVKHRPRFIIEKKL
ncbi:MAG: glycosyltransferase family 2 protein [Deltaproteobacteria bacterium]|jgi:glycosyltransferase involved in cell wall biosynthesis|nr:glycosyltransferase family 2 protein [Deltaproteobacteria bacterium]